MVTVERSPLAIAEKGVKRKIERIEKSRARMCLNSEVNTESGYFIRITEYQAIGQ